jgi:hypothetical protein
MMFAGSAPFAMQWTLAELDGLADRRVRLIG